MISLHYDGASVLALWKNGGVGEKHPKQTASAPNALQRWNNEGGALKSGGISTRKHRPKRPRKLNRPAKGVAGSATGDLDEPAPAVPPHNVLGVDDSVGSRSLGDRQRTRSPRNRAQPLAPSPEE